MFKKQSIQRPRKFLGFAGTKRLTEEIWIITNVKLKSYWSMLNLEM